MKRSREDFLSFANKLRPLPTSVMATSFLRKKELVAEVRKTWKMAAALEKAGFHYFDLFEKALRLEGELERSGGKIPLRPKVFRDD